MTLKNGLQLDIDFAAKAVKAGTRNLRGSVRGNDPIESQVASARVQEKCSALERRIVEIIVTEGPQSAKRLEARREFAQLGPSTVRRRVSALLNERINPATRLTYLVQAVDSAGAPLREDGCAIYDLQARSPALQVSCSEEQQEQGKQEHSAA